MSQHTVAVIGTGAEPGEGEGVSATMGYRHGEAYAGLESCELVACADVVPENAAGFADAFGIDPSNAPTDHVAMLEDAAPDLVSVTTPIPTHAAIAP